MNFLVKQIKNPRVRELAAASVITTTGDFGMLVEGGADLERFAELIIEACLDATRGAVTGVETYCKYFE